MIITTNGVAYMNLFKLYKLPSRYNKIVAEVILQYNNANSSSGLFGKYCLFLIYLYIFIILITLLVVKIRSSDEKILEPDYRRITEYL